MNEINILAELKKAYVMIQSIKDNSTMILEEEFGEIETSLDKLYNKVYEKILNKDEQCLDVYLHDKMYVICSSIVGDYTDLNGDGFDCYDLDYEWFNDEEFLRISQVHSKLERLDRNKGSICDVVGCDKEGNSYTFVAYYDFEKNRITHVDKTKEFEAFIDVAIEKKVTFNDGSVFDFDNEYSILNGETYLKNKTKDKVSERGFSL